MSDQCIYSHGSLNTVARKAINVIVWDFSSAKGQEIYTIQY